MFGEALGVMLVLVLGGLIVPILLIVGAVVLDLLFALWAMYRRIHDGLWPSLVEHLTRATQVAAPRLHPHV